MNGNDGGAIPPGATIGILGGGQLGRMTALAAARLGYRAHVFCPEDDSPATQVAAAVTVAPYEDEAALAEFARRTDVVTIEFENIPVEALERLAETVPVRPAPHVLRLAQDRLREKDFLREIGVPAAPYLPVKGAASVARALANLGRPAVLKTVRLGYDGKGQVLINPETDPAEAWEALGAEFGVLERFVDFRCEISVILARRADGRCVTFPASENRHVGGILDTTIVPARIAGPTAERAEAVARRLAEALDVVGLLAVEMFVPPDGRVLVNEMAPRPHNSGHWTLDACVTSQFEQLVRAICGLPLGSTAALADATMKNLLGDDVERWAEYLSDPNAKLHLYGKREARPGRKMGHVTRIMRPV
jgi:5-(carboxyamino)imidazole ribonucleotide synthase